MELGPKHIQRRLALLDDIQVRVNPVEKFPGAGEVILPTARGPEDQIADLLAVEEGAGSLESDVLVLGVVDPTRDVFLPGCFGLLDVGLVNPVIVVDFERRI